MDRLLITAAVICLAAAVAAQLPTANVVATIASGWASGPVQQPASGDYVIQFSPRNTTGTLNVVVYSQLGTAAGLSVSLTNEDVFPLSDPTSNTSTPYQGFRVPEAKQAAGRKNYVTIRWAAASNDVFWAYIWPDSLNTAPSLRVSSAMADSEPNDAADKAQPALRFPNPQQSQAISGWLKRNDVDSFLINVPPGKLLLSAKFANQPVGFPEPKTLTLLPDGTNFTFDVSPVSSVQGLSTSIYEPRTGEVYWSWMGTVTAATNLTLRLSSNLGGALSYPYTLDMNLLDTPSQCKGADEAPEPNDGVRGPATQLLSSLPSTIAGQLCRGDVLDVYTFRPPTTNFFTFILSAPADALPGVGLALVNQDGIVISCAGLRCADQVGVVRARAPFVQALLDSTQTYSLKVDWSGASPLAYFGTSAGLAYSIERADAPSPTPTPKPANCSRVDVQRVVDTLNPRLARCIRTPLRIKKAVAGTRAQCGVSSFSTVQNLDAFLQANSSSQSNPFLDYGFEPPVTGTPDRRRFTSPLARLRAIALAEEDSALRGFVDFAAAERAIASAAAEAPVSSSRHQLRTDRPPLAFEEPCPVPKDWTLVTCPAGEFCALNADATRFECQPEAADGEPCSASLPCTSHGPYELKCYQPSGGSGFVCGQTGYLAPGEACELDEQCELGASCQDGVCAFAAPGAPCIRSFRPNYPDAGLMCPPDQYCSYENIPSKSPSATLDPFSEMPTPSPTKSPQTPSRTVSPPPLVGASCAPRRGTGDACFTSEECQVDHLCVGRQCVKKYSADLGEPCFAVMTSGGAPQRTDDVCKPGLSCTSDPLNNKVRACTSVATLKKVPCTSNKDCASLLSDESECRCDVRKGESLCRLLRGGGILDKEEALLKCATQNRCDPTLPFYRGSCLDRFCFKEATRLRRAILEKQAEILFETPNIDSSSAPCALSVFVVAMALIAALLA